MGARERNKRETHARILQAAKVLYAERGVTGTTADDLAEAAGVSRATFFNYFRSKDEVLTAL
ncbi:helix-turn-helix domain-containing protein [Microbispora sp. CA-102843]|uniref:helix-turn-helix domain-containing protein n=1 Tax=Microbispora sp. CA-102843 TaxID=3239952 RepID=UPI003D9317E9